MVTDEEWDDAHDAFVDDLNEVISKHWDSYLGPRAWAQSLDEEDREALLAAEGGDDPGMPHGWVLLISVGKASTLDASGNSLREAVPRGQNRHMTIGILADAYLEGS